MPNIFNILNFDSKLLTKLIKNKNRATILLYGFLSKWYLLLMSLVMVVVYWVITGLYQAGVVHSAMEAFTKASNNIKAVAQHCTPRITNIKDFIQCIIHTPAYQPDEQASQMDEYINQLIQDIKRKRNLREDDPLDPYGSRSRK